MTPAMSILLDLVRGLAALVVLVGHARGMDLYTGPYPFSPYLQHHAVIVFFVLSGLVIAHSVRQKPLTLADYALARGTRIVPVALFAIVLSLALWAWSRAAGLQEAMPAPYGEAGLANIILPAFFLSETAWGAGLVWNPPYWSLVCEVFFYALFGAAVFLAGPTRWIALVLIALLAGWKVLVLLPIWLMGVALAWWPERFRHGKTASWSLLGSGAIMAVLADAWTVEAVSLLSRTLGLSYETLDFAKFLIVDFAMGIAVSMVFVGMRPLAEMIAPLLTRAVRPIRWLAGISFTLYIVHHPILLLIRGYGIGAGDNAVVFAVLLGFVIAVSALMAATVEHRTPALRRWLKTQLLQRRPMMA